VPFEGLQDEIIYNYVGKNPKHLLLGTNTSYTKQMVIFSTVKENAGFIMG
jgi:hypothetical protein